VSVALLGAVFLAWWLVERTLSMHSIRTARREMFYWLAIRLARCGAGAPAAVAKRRAPARRGRLHAVKRGKEGAHSLVVDPWCCNADHGGRSRAELLAVDGHHISRALRCSSPNSLVLTSTSPAPRLVAGNRIGGSSCTDASAWESSTIFGYHPHI
jgi:hypothetical protein